MFIFITLLVIFIEGHLTEFVQTKGHRRLKRLGITVVSSKNIIKTTVYIKI